MKTLYVQRDGLVIRKNGQDLTVTEGKQIINREPVIALASIVIMGNSQITEQALRFSARNNISIVHADRSGRAAAYTSTFSENDCSLRLLQYSLYSDASARLGIAKEICRCKLNAQKNYLMKRQALHADKRSLFESFFADLEKCSTINQVLGVEGQAAHFYFLQLGSFSSFKGRSRRPAKDVFNSLLNLTYSMILHHLCSVLLSKGFDVSLGFLHSYKNGRPSLGLDVLELFRSEADSFVVNITNRKEFSSSDFLCDAESGGMYLTSGSFRKYLEKYSKAFEDSLPIEEKCTWLHSLLQKSHLSLGYERVLQE